MTDAERAVAALRGGGLAVIPTDTVYGLACDARSEPAAHALYALKGRSEIQPTAVVAAEVDALLDLLPELRGESEALCRRLLPGPFTLVLPNPAARLEWLCGDRPHTIGVRVPDLSGPGAAVLRDAGPVAATSANLPGGRDPRRLDEVPASILSGAVAVAGGVLPGTPSTVLDLTGEEPVVVREGAIAAADALARIAG